MESQEKEGFCVFKENETFTYKGEFEQDTKNGYGMVYKKDQIFLEGLFLNNKLLCGCLYFHDNKWINKIEFINSENSYIDPHFNLQGLGTVYLRGEEQIECKLSNILQIIHFDENQRIFGRMKLPNELEYEGTFQKFQMHGVGRLIKNGLIIYEGFFQNGLYNGIGVEYLNDGKQTLGKFSKGMNNGIRVITDTLEETQQISQWKLNIAYPLVIEQNLKTEEVQIVKYKNKKPICVMFIK